MLQYDDYSMLAFTDTPGQSSDKTKARRVGCHKTPTMSFFDHEKLAFNCQKSLFRFPRAGPENESTGRLLTRRQ